MGEEDGGGKKGQLFPPLPQRLPTSGVTASTLEAFVGEEETNALQHWRSGSLVDDSGTDWTDLHCCIFLVTVTM